MQLCVLGFFDSVAFCRFQMPSTATKVLLLIYIFRHFFFDFVCVSVDSCASARTILNAARWFFWIHVCYVNTYKGWCLKRKTPRLYASKPKIFRFFICSFVRWFRMRLVSVRTFIQPNEFAHRENESEKHIYLEQIYSTLTLTDLCEKVSLFLRCWRTRARALVQTHTSFKSQREKRAFDVCSFRSFHSHVAPNIVRHLLYENLI